MLEQGFSKQASTTVNLGAYIPTRLTPTLLGSTGTLFHCHRKMPTTASILGKGLAADLLIRPRTLLSRQRQHQHHQLRLAAGAGFGQHPPQLEANGFEHDALVVLLCSVTQVRE
jgi:hypothetical protein